MAERSWFRQIRWVLALLSVFALLAASCGDDGGDEAGTTTSAPDADGGDDGGDDDGGDDDGADDDGSSDGESDGESDDGGEPAVPTATDIGVTESVIRLGVVFPDINLIGRDGGDLEAKFRTIADAINDAGGIHGRTIEMTFRAPNPLLDDDFTTACVEFVEDLEIFAAIGLFPRTTADCYAQLNDTIVISTFAITPDQMANYTAPGITIEAHSARLVESRIQALMDGGVLREGMPIAVVGGTATEAQHELYVEALDAAGLDVAADTIVLGDGQDLLALTDEMATLTEVWKSSGAEAVVASSSLMSQAILIGYNEGDIDLPFILPEGTGVNPSLLRDQQGLDLAPFELAVALVEGDDQATKYETGADGVADCVDTFEAASGEDVALDESRNNLGPTIVACQVFDIFVQIADAAGVDLTTESFAAAAEAFGPIDVTDLSAASLGPDKLDLNDSVGVVGEYNAEAAQFQPIA